MGSMHVFFFTLDSSRITLRIEELLKLILPEQTRFFRWQNRETNET